MAIKQIELKSSSLTGTVPRVFGSLGLGVKTTGVPCDLEVLATLEPPLGLKEYYKMKFNDPVIGGILWHIESIFRRCQVVWDGDTPDSISGALGQSFWSRILTEVGSALTYGFYVGEMIWQTIDGLPMLIDIEPRFQPTLYRFIDGMIEQVGATSSAEIPQVKCLHVTIGAEARSPYGTSMLRSVYKPYYMKTNIEATEANSLDRDLEGLPVMTAPEGFDFMRADDTSDLYDENVGATLTWAINVVQNIRKDTQQGVVKPNGWVLELLRAQGEHRDTDGPIKRYNTSICVGLLENLLAPLLSERGRASEGEIHASVFVTAINSFIYSFISDINDQVISKLQRIYGFDGKLKAHPVTNYNLRDLASYIGRLVSQQVIIPSKTLQKAILDIVDIDFKEDKNET